MRVGSVDVCAAAPRFRAQMTLHEMVEAYEQRAQALEYGAWGEMSGLRPRRTAARTARIEALADEMRAEAREARADPVAARDMAARLGVDLQPETKTSTGLIHAVTVSGLGVAAVTGRPARTLCGETASPREAATPARVAGQCRRCLPADRA